jgi:hypothetical protein
VRLCGLVLLLACSRSAPPVLPPPQVPAPAPSSGLAWITPEQPFQLHTATTSAVFDGAALVLAGRHGWVARFDPATGSIVQERRIGDLAIQHLLALRDGRWFVVGASKGRVVAFTLDQRTFEPTEVKLKPTREDIPFVSAAVLDDGRVALGGYGFPLALYDPKTWAVDKVLDTIPGWAQLQVRGGKLFAERRFETHRFDPVTGEDHKLAEGYKMAASAKSIAIGRYNPVDKWSIEVISGESKHSIRVSGHVQSHTLDRAGNRLAAIVDTKLEIRDATSGNLEHAIELGARAWLPGVLMFDAEGTRLVVTNGSTVRVVDVATGAISRAGGPPEGGVKYLAVANDGTVLAQGVQQHQLVAGKITATAPGDWRLFRAAAGEVTRYATSVEKGNIGSMQVRVTLHALGQTGAIRTWQLTQQPTSAWLASDGNVAIEARGDGTLPHQLLRSEGERLLPIITLNENAVVYDIDLDTGFALVGIDGALHTVRVADAKAQLHLLQLPQCNRDGDAELERRGVRVVAYHETEVLVWDRTTGAMRGAARFGARVTQVIPVRNRDEVIVVAGRHMSLWSVDSGVVRTLETPSDHVVALSPDTRKLAIAHASGRIALYELAALRAALPTSRVDKIKPPKPCESRDPFAPEVHEPYPAEPPDGSP